MRVVLAVGAAVAVLGWAVVVFRYVRLVRAYARAQAAYRLTAGCLARDRAAFRERLEELVARQASEDEVLVEAGRVLDKALAGHWGGPWTSDSDDVEGGPA